MNYLAVALITIAAFAGDFLSHWLEFSKAEQKGWSWTSTACLLYAGYYLWKAFDKRPDEGKKFLFFDFEKKKAEEKN